MKNNFNNKLSTVWCFFSYEKTSLKVVTENRITSKCELYQNWIYK